MSTVESKPDTCPAERFVPMPPGRPWQLVMQWNRRYPPNTEVKWWDADESVRRSYTKGPAFVWDPPEGSEIEAYAAVWVSREEVPTPLEKIFVADGDIIVH